MGKIKVLYLHALESGPGSLKHKYLDTCGFDVQCPKLNSGTWMTRLRLMAGAMVALLITLWTTSWVLWWFLLRAALPWWVPIIAMVVVLGLLFGMFILFKRLFLRLMLDEAVTVADKVAKEWKPDIIVGQSFGCVCALHMKHAKRTPLLLLAPANKLFHGHAGMWKEPDLSPYPFVTVVHGDSDQFIPLEHSVELTNTALNNNYLEVIPMEDHRLLSLGDFELREYVHTTVFKVDPELASSSMWAVPPPAVIGRPPGQPSGNGRPAQGRAEQHPHSQ